MDTHHSLPRARPRTFLFFLLLIVLLSTAAACRGGDDGNDNGRQYGDQAELSGQVFLVCSDNCANRAQCGTSPEKGRVVLLSTQGPAGTNHNLSIAENTAVSVVQFRTEPAFSVAQESLTIPYYEVAVPERGNAWVAGWCVSNQPNE
jgi:hypothetical protein